jgi:hypothetical protein
MSGAAEILLDKQKYVLEARLLGWVNNTGFVQLHEPTSKQDSSCSALDNLLSETVSILYDVNLDFELIWKAELFCILKLRRNVSRYHRGTSKQDSSCSALDNLSSETVSTLDDVNLDFEIIWKAELFCILKLKRNVSR